MKNYFVKWLNIKTDNSGYMNFLPVIYTDQGVLISYLHYLLDNKDKSESWMKQNIQSIGLLISYNSANKDRFSQPKEMFTEFSNRLFTGTIDEKGNDDSGLRWKPRKTKTANKIISMTTNFADWLAKENGDNNNRLNPWQDASTYEEILNWAAWAHRYKHAFLAHTWSMNKAKQQNKLSRRVRNKISPKIDEEPVKAFPEDKINALLTQGFILPRAEHKSNFHERLNLRDVLIVYLMHYGGIRLSETLHIYLHDITENKMESGHALIKVYHPSEGEPPKGRHNKSYDNRSTYLVEEFGLRPRNEKSSQKILHAGWKNPMLDSNHGNYFVVQWAPTESAKQFLALWKAYIQYQRISPQSDKKHPFAFTTKDGSPYTIGAFQDNYKRAVNRIGLTKSHDYGIAPHGHRHAFGKRLFTYGLPEKIIQKALHHNSYESQRVYTAPSQADIENEFKKAFTEKNSYNLPSIT